MIFQMYNAQVKRNPFFITKTMKTMYQFVSICQLLLNSVFHETIINYKID